MEAWIPFLPLIGVVIGLVANPAINAVGYYFRRRHEEQDRAKFERRSALIALQDAIIDHIEAREMYSEIEQIGATLDQQEQYQRELGQLSTRAETTERRIRQLAARIGDDTLWNLINNQLSLSARREEEAQSRGKRLDYIGDDFDRWNERIHDLFKVL